MNKLKEFIVACGCTFHYATRSGFPAIWDRVIYFSAPDIKSLEKVLLKIQGYGTVTIPWRIESDEDMVFGLNIKEEFLEEFEFKSRSFNEIKRSYYLKDR